NEAQTFCREKHTDLITIRSKEESSVFPYTLAWIGLYRDNNYAPWKWSRGDEIPSFTNWYPSEPQRNEHCAAKWNQEGQWLNYVCSREHNFICVAEKLVLVRENKTWEEALEHCRSLNEDKQNNQGYEEEKGFDLATLNTADYQNFALERAQQATTEEVWIGLRYLGDDWFWVGGEPGLYQNISSCPAVRCGVLEKNSSTLFGIRDCSQRRNFFCYKKPHNP
uniref:C-type lectin domain-containing protein n=1 Tax=Fundulus heteroclitus TaxID=8078 RepID=A0A3Q2QIG5_FUNHE